MTKENNVFNLQLVLPTIVYLNTEAMQYLLQWNLKILTILPILTWTWVPAKENDTTISIIDGTARINLWLFSY